ncbi:LysR family transcriptional regulator [Edwardsiella tarda]|uniref:LysR family transcriptional regulator n=1 Tax=Edwardsiella tarda TaxID=636 RepID=UPI0034DCEC02
MHITLRQLTAFSEIVKTGSASAAALSLNTSQSAISTALSDLEASLNTDLFDRIGRRLIINGNGRYIYPKVCDLLERISDIQHAFNTGSSILHLGTSSTIGSYFFPDIIADYQSESPGAKIDVMVDNTHEVIQAVLNHNIDIGFIEAPTSHPDLISQLWLEDELVVFTSSSNSILNNKITPDTLAEIPWVLREKGSGTRDSVNDLLLSKLPETKIAMELGCSEAIKRVVARGVGVSCLSRKIIEHELSIGSLVEIPLSLEKLSRYLYIIHHKQKKLSSGLANFLLKCKIKCNSMEELIQQWNTIN